MKPRETFQSVTPDAISAIAALFDTDAERQEFDIPNSDHGVWQVNHRSESGNIRVLLWPAIDRIDVTVGPHMWVVKGVREVEVIQDLEFIARFAHDGVLTVARNGQVVLTTTSPSEGGVT
ncbi:MAG: hypothetical protein OXS30_13085 [Chloroflexota bacterium]|nr:hypothetical protein [Chloroflexota bacterium]